MAVFALLVSSKLISRKIWAIQKSWNFHTVHHWVWNFWATLYHKTLHTSPTPIYQEGSILTSQVSLCCQPEPKLWHVGRGLHHPHQLQRCHRHHVAPRLAHEFISTLFSSRCYNQLVSNSIKMIQWSGRVVLKDKEFQKWI